MPLAAVPVFVMTLFYREKNDRPLKVITLSAFKESFVNFFSHPRLRGIAFVDMATYFVFGTFETFLPLFLASRGVDPYQTGIIFAVQVLMIATTKPIFGWIADRIDKRIQICIGLLLSGIAIAAIPLFSSFPHFIVIITVAGFTAGFFASFALALVITGVFVWSVFA